MGSGTFDVTQLVVTEPATAEAPTNIIPQLGEFSVTATFTGSGTLWNNLKNMNPRLAYEVIYFIEGIGASSVELDLGVHSGYLDPTKNVYEGADTTFTVAAPDNQLPVGIYRVGCTVTFPTFPGTTGFLEDFIIQIYKP
jgi:hypothetical protein